MVHGEDGTTRAEIGGDGVCGVPGPWSREARGFGFAIFPRSRDAAFSGGEGDARKAGARAGGALGWWRCRFDPPFARRCGSG